MLRIAVFIGYLILSGVAHANAEQLRQAAGALLASLSEAHRAAMVYPLDNDARATWSNLPTLMAPPAGVMVGDLDDAQRTLVHRMLQTSLSGAGYMKSSAIMWLDDILGMQEKANLARSESAGNNPTAVAMAQNRSSGNYAIAIFGKPDDANWGWKMTGHHLAVNITVANDRIGALPGYYGSNPRVIPAGPYAGYAALSGESEFGIELMQSLTAAQQTTATIGGETPQDVIEGPGRRASLRKFEGLAAKQLDGRQLGLLQRLVGEYVKNAAADSAALHLDAIAASGWDNLWFSWRGPVDLNGQFYYRVHGPRLLVEYNRQDPNHDHSVIRDPKNDYGEDWLGHHYKETHPSPAEYMENLRRGAAQ